MNAVWSRALVGAGPGAALAILLGGAPAQAQLTPAAAGPGALPGGAVELMPPQAFWPPPYLRGLEGGSVWLNPVHGLQWPYYRRTGLGISGDLWIDTAYEKIDR